MTVPIALQHRFALAVAKLINMADNLGYFIRLGESWRSPEEADRHRISGTSRHNYVYANNLAISVVLFSRSSMEELEDIRDYAKLGHWFVAEFYAYGAAWGGDQPDEDVHHFALTYQGNK